MAQPHSISSVDAEGRDVNGIQEGAWLKAMKDVYVDKIVIVGAPSSWASKKLVKAEGAGADSTATVEYTPAGKGRAAFAVIKKAGVRIGSDWKLTLA